MSLSLAELEAIRQEAFADDLPIHDAMLAWSSKAARAYFESGGAIKASPAEIDLIASLIASIANGPAYVAQPKAFGSLDEIAVFEVLHSPRVAVREAPSTSAKVLTAVRCGDDVMVDRFSDDGGWVHLCAGDFGLEAGGWMLMDGRSLGLGTLWPRFEKL